ncbi:MAG: Na/Pi symporter [Opitutales bacterium]|jgi:phosphate:Na+ symporter
MHALIDLCFTILAGLGLFFVGLKLLGSNLKGLAGKQFKRLIERVSGRPLAAALGGVAAGFITQSGRTTSYLVAGFVQAGLIDVRRALPLVLWSNFGCTLIVFAAVLPVREVILLLVGLAGLAVAFNYPARWPAASGALFGVALLLFGLTLVTQAAGGFTQYAWFKAALSTIHFSYFLGFLVGMLLTFLAQSHMAIILIALAMTKAGFFDFGQAAMIIYGTHAGSSLITYAMAANIRGTARQLVMAQVFYNLIGVVLFVGWFYVEFFTGMDGMHLLIERFSDQPERQAAVVALLFNLVTPMVCMLVIEPGRRLLERHWAPSERETLARPLFLQEHALEEPETALLLVEKEQLRLLDWLPGHLEAARSGGMSFLVAKREVHHEAFHEVAEQTRRYLMDLLQHALSADATEQVLNLQNRQEHLETLEGVVWGMLQNLRDQHLHPGDAVMALGLQLIEGFDTQLLTLSAALSENDAEELALLRKMTAEHGEVMENLRRSYFASGEGLAVADRPRLLQLTNLFERGTWTVRRYANLVASAQERRTEKPAS